MKPQLLKITLAVMLLMALYLYSCKNKSSESNVTDVKTEIVTKAFEADFVGTYKYVGLDTISSPKCNDSLPMRIIVNCKGTSNIMGAIDANFDFCGNDKGDYGVGYGYFVDESSDTLFIDGTFNGKVIQGRTETHPEFVISYWKDEFKFSGGTGKYEGATGKVMSDDYNSSQDPNSHHHWKGTITLVEETE